jgi:hypothetical protein
VEKPEIAGASHGSEALLNPERPGRRTPARTNLLLDTALLVALFLALSPGLTGLAIHEWLSLALAAAVVTHLLLHWEWTRCALSRFFRRLAAQSRLRLLLNVMMFVDFTVVMLSGVMISRFALPAFGIVLNVQRAWVGLHRLSADLSVFLTGLHVALHWKWVACNARRYTLDPLVNVLRGPERRQGAAPATLAVRHEVEK